MDVREARVVLRERRLLDVLDLALRFLIAHPGPYLVVSAFVLVPCAVASVVAWTHLGLTGGLATSVALSALAELPLTMLGSRLVFERNVALADVARDSVRRAPLVLVGRTLIAMSFVVGASLFVIPGVWVAATFLFVPEIIALERAGVGVAMTRAQRMTSGRFGEAVLAVAALALVHAGAAVVGDRALTSALRDLLQLRPPPTLGQEDGGVLALVAFWLAVPYVATARLFAYLDLRTRTEGWDPQVRFAALAQRAEP